ncbi:MAG TPA: hypothetical protein VFM95_03925 [Microcella sp.]|nr:hypothetical protein [Microcella sp.]
MVAVVATVPRIRTQPRERAPRILIRRPRENDNGPAEAGPLQAFENSN